MTALAWAALIGGLACVPIADPTTRRWVRARLRLRRMRRGTQGIVRLQHDALLSDIRGTQKSRSRRIRAGYHSLAEKDHANWKQLTAELAELKKKHPWLT